MNSLDLLIITKDVIQVFVIVVLFKNIIFLLLNPWYQLKEKHRHVVSMKKWQESHPHKEYTPLVSVIIPAWNEEVGVIKTIESIIQNTYKHKEIVVVNDGSTDNTHEVITEFLAQLKTAKPHLHSIIKYIKQENGGKGKALNTGVKNASGDIIVTCDADSAFSPDALDNLVKYYLDNEIMAVVGKVEVDVSENKTWVGLIQHLEYQFGFYNKRAHAVMDAEYIFGGACASFRKEVFETLGLFDEENKTEDIEMSMRTRYAGMKCTYAEDVVCYTEGASDIPSLISQRVRWKKGRFDTFLRYKKFFFSTKPEHNFFMSFFVLPFSLFTELVLFFEPIAVAILLVYTFITGEFISISIGILFIGIVYVVGSLFSGSHKNMYALLSFPFTWLAFYVLDWVEYISLLKSAMMYIYQEDVIWQNWQRRGLK